MNEIKDIRKISVLAIFSALSIVLGKYLAINIGENYRLSFENLPIILAGIFFGGVAGAFVGVVADLVGCLLVGYAINPIITLGALMIGFVSGAIWSIFYAMPNLPKSIIAVFSAHMIGSVLIKTVGLYIYFDAPFLITFLTRLAIYTAVGIAELLAVFFLTKNKGFMNQIKRAGK